MVEPIFVIVSGLKYNSLFACVTERGRTNEDVEFIGTLKDLDHVLRNSDFLAISIPLSKRTRNLITEKELDTMKKDAVLVNIARGRIVNMEDMFHHLKAHPNFQAAFDVWGSCPKSGQKYWDRIFQPFERVAQDEKGTGLGLSIVKNIVERHGGCIWIEAKFGEGSTFYVTGPKEVK